MYGSANDDDQKFIQNLSMFFGTSLRVYSASLFERQMGYEGPVSDAHQYLLKLSMVDDTENFKICLDYWNAFLLELKKKLEFTNHQGLCQTILPRVPSHFSRKQSSFARVPLQLFQKFRTS